MGSVFIAIIVLCILPLIFKRAFVGVLAWSWLSFMYPHRLVYGFATRFPFLDAVAGSTILAALFSKDKKRFPAHPVLVPYVVYALWVCLTTLFAQEHDLAVDKLSTTLKAMLLGFLVPVLITTKHRMMMLIMTVAGSFGFFALKGGAFTVVTGGQHQVIGPIGTFIEDRNDLAMALVMTIPLFRFVQLHAENVWIKRGALGLMLGAAISVLGSQSRGGLLALAIVGFWLILTSRHRISMTIAAGVIALFAVNFMPDTWKNRMESVQTYQEDNSAMGRLNMWRYGMELAKDYPLGIGFKAYKMKSVAPEYLPEGIKLRASHSIYFEVLGEHGYVGLFLFLFLYSSAFICFGETRKLAKQHGLDWARDLASLVQAGLVAYAVGGAFLEVASFDLSFQYVGIAIALNMLVKEIIQEKLKQSQASPAAKPPLQAGKTRAKIA